MLCLQVVLLQKPWRYCCNRALSPAPPGVANQMQAHMRYLAGSWRGVWDLTFRGILTTDSTLAMLPLPICASLL
jgi:hypothetical protein